MKIWNDFENDNENDFRDHFNKENDRWRQFQQMQWCPFSHHLTRKFKQSGFIMHFVK